MGVHHRQSEPVSTWGEHCKEIETRFLSKETGLVEAIKTQSIGGTVALAVAVIGQGRASQRKQGWEIAAKLDALPPGATDAYPITKKLV